MEGGRALYLSRNTGTECCLEAAEVKCHSGRVKGSDRHTEIKTVLLQDRHQTGNSDLKPLLYQEHLV